MKNILNIIINILLLIWDLFLLLLMLVMSIAQICSFFVEELLGAYPSETMHIIAATLTIGGTIFMYWTFFTYVIEIKIKKIKKDV